MSTVRLEGLAKSYGDHAVLRDLSVTIRDGECFTFLGPSGCGKTVVLRLIAGFEHPDAGEIRIGDTVVSSPAKKLFVPPERRRIGVVFQDYAVWPHKTVYENVVYPLALQDVAKPQARERTLEALQAVSLDAFERRLPYQLSGGQQQRVALARALVSRPEIMLLDEPLSNLDANLREEMRFEIKELQRSTGVTILYVTHDQEVALAISDRIAILDGEGRIRQIGSPDDVYERPADPFVFQFMGVCNFIPVDWRDGRPFAQGSDVALERYLPPALDARLRGGGAVAGCRPSDVRVVEPGTGLPGTLKRVTFLGSTMDYRIGIGATDVRVQEDASDALSRPRDLREGDAVGLELLDVKWFPRERAAPAGGATP